LVSDYQLISDSGGRRRGRRREGRRSIGVETSRRERKNSRRGAFGMNFGRFVGRMFSSFFVLLKCAAVMTQTTSAAAAASAAAVMAAWGAICPVFWRLAYANETARRT